MPIPYECISYLSPFLFLLPLLPVESPLDSDFES